MGTKSGPSRRVLKFQNLNDAIDEVEHLSAVEYERAGNWSLEQNLDHLNKTLRMAIEGPTFFYPAIIRPIARWISYPMMKRGKQVGVRTAAPKDLRPDQDSDLDLAALKKEFRELCQTVMDPATELTPIHPLLGRINHEQWNVMQSWHAAHHLSFLIPRSETP